MIKRHFHKRKYMDSCLPDVHDQTQDIFGKVFQNRKCELFLILNHSVHSRKPNEMKKI